MGDGKKVAVTNHNCVRSVVWLTLLQLLRQCTRYIFMLIAVIKPVPTSEGRM
ncbi:unnamed protein product, partial [Brassica oleracea]